MLTQLLLKEMILSRYLTLMNYHEGKKFCLVILSSGSMVELPCVLVSARATRFVHFAPRNGDFWHFLKNFVKYPPTTSGSSPKCDILEGWAVHVCNTPKVLVGHGMKKYGIRICLQVKIWLFVVCLLSKQKLYLVA